MTGAEDQVAAALEAGQPHALPTGEAPARVLLHRPLIRLRRVSGRAAHGWAGLRWLDRNLNNLSLRLCLRHRRLDSHLSPKPSGLLCRAAQSCCGRLLVDSGLVGFSLALAKAPGAQAQRGRVPAAAHKGARASFPPLPGKPPRRKVRLAVSLQVTPCTAAQTGGCASQPRQDDIVLVRCCRGTYNELALQLLAHQGARDAPKETAARGAQTGLAGLLILVRVHIALRCPCHWPAAQLCSSCASFELKTVTEGHSPGQAVETSRPKPLPCLQLL